ncbi:hypothetical protein COM90_15675 [Bacillus thuringiensis]|uniref:Uncharacterized protein n=1 Tax=Bacillus thuringiensis TaxID=1428 RepID=A0AB36TTY3_BACTU|nr:hypothetical protein COM74_31085 [Bacillus thuringiensis]PEE87888.1 hypothetical protein COM90_15675 [Bacillus thuringiensis]PFM88135.1 hypothetical protein COJ61_22190 [Bacillus thuringiensis]
MLIFQKPIGVKLKNLETVKGKVANGKDGDTDVNINRKKQIVKLLLLDRLESVSQKFKLKRCKRKQKYQRLACGVYKML